MTAIVTTGDARNLPLPDESVDLIVTSPPYFALRKYAPGDDTRPAIGEESTPAEFVASLVEVTRDCARVLKPSGSMFVNLGDKYGPGKSLLCLPERYRIACTDELGLIARAVIIWSKPNGLPESVRDRVRRSHEDWLHLTKSPRYFEAVDEIREAADPKWAQRRLTPDKLGAKNNPDRVGGWAFVNTEKSVNANPLGKLPGSVWSIATQPLRVPPEVVHAACCGGTPVEGCTDGIDHFAAFPMEWPRRLITGWCPREVCSACGEGRRPVTTPGALTPEGEAIAARRTNTVDAYSVEAGRGGGEDRALRQRQRLSGSELARHSTGLTITGYACACPDTSAPSTPGVVLDPFGGTGTTALMADVLGRVGISLDAAAGYVPIARWRTADPRERAKARTKTTSDVGVHDSADQGWTLFSDVAS